MQLSSCRHVQPPGSSVDVPVQSPNVALLDALAAGVGFRCQEEVKARAISLPAKDHAKDNSFTRRAVVRSPQPAPADNSNSSAVEIDLEEVHIGGIAGSARNPDAFLQR